MIDLTLSSKFRTHYQKEYPYPHIVIDNFLHPQTLEKAWIEMENFEYFGYDGTTYSAEHQVNKFFTPWCDENINDIRLAAPTTYFLMEYFNSPEFINFIEKLTGIYQLIPDNTWFGGAVHKIERGGKLDIHADYTKHRFIDMYRRLTMLIYMNKVWDLKWGGNLELWDKKMENRVKEIEPIFNRMVLFNVTNDSYHGHPKPMECPPNTSRYSFSICYFTKNKPVEIKEELSAVWRQVPKI
jgi:Rps23 Pro-64 3,4-dihydroxylase Tpa1-like proline 4-hydroxylase